MSSNTEITAPVAKAATAMTAGAGTSALSVATNAGSFLPTDLNGWMALVASSAAVVYSVHLLGEWYWKKVWRPFLESRGWIAPKKVPKNRRWTDDDAAGTE